MEEKMKSPCAACGKTDGECTYPRCEDYRVYVNRFWNRCRRWPQREREKPKPRGFLYDAPYLVTRSLERGPCPGCPLKGRCGDRDTCESYDAWVEARMRRIRYRLGKAPENRKNAVAE